MISNILAGIISALIVLNSAQGAFPSDSDELSPERRDQIHAAHALRAMLVKGLPADEHDNACRFLLATMGEPPAALRTRWSIDASGKQHQFNEVFHNRAGSGWRAPDGATWYRGPDEVTYTVAKKYCEDLGLNVPTEEQFEGLATYMGAFNRIEQETYIIGQSYRPQVLPNLAKSFWTSSWDPRYRDVMRIFYGASPSGHTGTAHQSRNSVLCVGN